MDNSELDPEPSFSTSGKSNNNELMKPLVLRGLNSDDATNYLALIHAIKASDVDNVKLLLKNCSIDKKSDTYTFDLPLYLAIEVGNLEIIELLHNAKASFLAISGGKTPLHKAMKNQQFDIVDLMLSEYNTANIDPKNKQAFVLFVTACIRNNGSFVQQFIHKGIDVNGVLDDHTPLFLSVKYSSVKVVEILLKNQADVNAKDSNGLTSLRIALQKKLYKIAELLLEFKAIISTEDKECCDAILQVFSDYPKTGKIIDMMFLACQGNLVNSVNEDGLSLLHVACTRNNVGVIKKLLLTTADVNACVHENSPEWAKYTPLHFAASAQNLDAIHVLLEYQADVNVVEGRGLIPLWLSLEAQPKYIEIKNIINDKFKNDIKTISKEQEETIQSLLEFVEYDKEAEIIGRETIEDEKLEKIIESLLQEFENIKVVELLVKSQSNLNHKSKSGVPLLFAAYQTLIDCFVNQVNKDKNSEVIFSKICSKYYLETAAKIMDCLIKHGIDLNICDSKNKHILHVIAHSASNKECEAGDSDSACWYYNCGHKQCIRLSVKIAEMILENGANVNVFDNSGSAPLHLAIGSEHACAKLVELFLRFDADVDVPDGNRSTPLHLSVTHSLNDELIYQAYPSNFASDHIDNFEKIFDCLFGSNCNVNARDASGRTPLHTAAHNRSKYCIELLLENGADINIKDSRNQSSFNSLGMDYKIFGFGDEYFFREVFKTLLWHVLKLLVIGHPVDPVHSLIHCELVAKSKKYTFYYRNICICEEEDSAFNYRSMRIGAEEDNDSESYYRDIFICEEIDHDRVISRGYNLELREKVAELRDEMAKLKDTKIDDYNSLYDILGKNLRQMTILARNKTLEKEVCSENLSARFPNYAYLLKLKFKDGSARNEILEKANESLRYVTRTNLPYILVDHIFFYISNRDMKNLILAAK